MGWSSGIGGGIGWILAGPPGAFTGHLVGGLAGKLIEQQIDGLSPLVTTALDLTVGEAAAERIQGLGQSIVQRRDKGTQEAIGNALHAAFRDACIEALRDIGDPHCFPGERSTGEPDEYAHIETSIVSRRWGPHPELADQVCGLLKAMVRNLQDGDNVPAAAASSDLWWSAEASKALATALYDQVVTPNLQPYESLLQELRAEHVYLGNDLQRMLFARLPVHLGRLVKSRTDAWRGFNEMVLEGLRARLTELMSKQEALQQGQQDIMARLEQVLGHLDSAMIIPTWSDGIATMLTEFETTLARLDENQQQRFDDVLTQLVFQSRSLDAIAAIDELHPCDHGRMIIGHRLQTVAEGRMAVLDED
jgi:hypothetical protein